MKKKNSAFRRINLILKNNKGIIITIILSGLVFLGIFKSMPSSNIDNMGGTHSWLSGSTIKFVNNWLEEGAANLNFTNYDAPLSIESSTLQDRDPYLSYPTGETFLVYSAAKLTGKNQISVGFLHKFQIMLFAIETVLLATFVYFFLTRTIRLKNETIKIIISVLTSTLWVMLPICSYYLFNIFFADQCVILWAMGAILVEYLIRSNEEKNLPLKIIRSIILFSGFLIDYYFWFLTAFLFMAEILDVWLKVQKKNKKKELLKILYWFGIPVLLSILVYFIQLNMTPNWLAIMKEKFGIRVVGEGKTIEWIVSAIVFHFIWAFSSLNDASFIYLLLIIFSTIIGTIIVLIKNHKMSQLIKNAGLSIITCNILAIITQILFFKQHSAIHEFSMIKVAWVVALLPLILSLVCYFIATSSTKVKGIREKEFFIIFVLGFSLVLFATGVPKSTENYSANRIEIKNYAFESMLAEQTDYYDVVFSYSEEIPLIPPQSLAISKKRIYKIQNIDEIASKMYGLDKKAKAVLIINKDTKLEKPQQKQIQCLEKNGLTRWEDNYFKIVDLNEFKGC